MNELWAQSSKQAANLKPKPRFFSGAGFLFDRVHWKEKTLT